MTTRQLETLADAIDHVTAAEAALRTFKSNYGLKNHEVDGIRSAKAHVRQAADELNNLNT